MMKMTTLTKTAFTEATVKMHSAEEAVDFLKNNLITRSVRSIIEKFSGGREMKEIQKLLVEGLLEDHPEMKKDSVERRVRGWLDPNSLRTVKKEDAIEIAFLLHLGIQETDEFLALISDENLHWRNVEEIIFIYGLQHGLYYKECMEIQNQPEIREILQKAKDCRTVDEIEEDDYTEFVKRDVNHLDSVEALKAYLEANYKKLGYFHNTAYDMFMEMLGKLKAPASMEDELELFDDGEASEKYTIRDILEDILYKDIVLTARQKAVKAKKEAKKSTAAKEKQYTLDIIPSWIPEIHLTG